MVTVTSPALGPKIVPTATKLLINNQWIPSESGNSKA